MELSYYEQWQLEKYGNILSEPAELDQDDREAEFHSLTKGKIYLWEYETYCEPEFYYN